MECVDCITLEADESLHIDVFRPDAADILEVALMKLIGAGVLSRDQAVFAIEDAADEYRQELTTDVTFRTRAIANSLAASLEAFLS